MNKTQNWTIMINGKNHHVKFTPNQWSFKKHILTADRQKVKLDFSSMKGRVGLDQAFKLGGKEIHFVMIGNKIDLAVDGVYIGSGKEYTPLEKTPIWLILFVAICALLPGINHFGPLSIVLGIIGIFLCIRISSAAMAMKKKVLYCTCISAVVWAIYYLIILLF